MAVLEIFASAFEGFIYLSFFGWIFIRKFHIAFLIAADILFALVMYYLRLCNALFLIFTLSTLVGLLLMTVLYKAVLRERLVYSSLLVVLGFVAELFSGCLLMAFNGVTFEEIAADQRLFIIGLIMAKLSHFFIVRITIRIIKKHNDPTPLGYWAGSLVVPAVSIAVMHGLAVISECFLQKDIIVILLSIGGILFLNMTWFLVYDCMVEHTINELSAQKDISFRSSEKIRNSVMMKYTKELMAHVHDVKHHFGLLSTLLDIGEYKKATDYAETVIKTSPLLSDNVIVPNYKEIDIILRQKIAEAEKNNIEVKYNIFIPPKIIEEDTKKITTLCMILGNSLDNAIEACLKVEGEKRIIIDIHNIQNKLAIKILNTSNFVKTNVNEIKTTKSDIISHGFGLSNMKKAIEEEGGNMVTKYSENMFSLYVTFIL